jgi:flagellar motility protein MotE (MotC chaperone)
MTGVSQGFRPASAGLARGLRAAALACALAVAGTVALAEQKWDTTVAPDAAAAKLPKNAPPMAPAPKPVAAPPLPPPSETKSAAKPDAASLAAKPPPAARARKGEAGSFDGVAKDYCVNIASAAADARLVLQKKELAGIEAEITKHMALLEEKIAEYRKWLSRRDEFSKKANDTVLRIYARMRPDAAASQLSVLDEETAAAVLMKLEPRTASLILNDMEPARAARLAATIAGAAKVTPPPPPTPAKAKPEGKQS